MFKVCFQLATRPPIATRSDCPKREMWTRPLQGALTFCQSKERPSVMPGMSRIHACPPGTTLWTTKNDPPELNARKEDLLHAPSLPKQGPAPRRMPGRPWAGMCAFKHKPPRCQARDPPGLHFRKEIPLSLRAPPLSTKQKRIHWQPIMHRTKSDIVNCIACLKTVWSTTIKTIKDVTSLALLMNHSWYFDICFQHIYIYI